ncbi:hypothetical protein [Magnetospirillum fulvum]|uniref:hypothetical protein n=1 Tax=Magnetospirillum fulvum TaxID=1082 RepID=UPI00111537E3|nr:hypothetical protein [Magnetospirillum fulvum]
MSVTPISSGSAPPSLAPSPLAKTARDSDTESNEAATAKSTETPPPPRESAGRGRSVDITA